MSIEVLEDAGAVVDRAAVMIADAARVAESVGEGRHMVEAMVFDLDGTLVQTERLKAISYARAALELCPHCLTEEDVLEEFKNVVGLSRREVALSLIERFNLAERAQGRMQEFGVSAPWQAFVEVRLRHYEEMLEHPRTLIDHQWPHNIALLKEARVARCKIGLATMSHRPQVQRVLGILGLENEFDCIATREDVERGKPDPEIYLLAARELNVEPARTLAIEDSLAGIRAALAAGMWCIAVTTPFTDQSIHSSGVLDEDRIVDDHATVLDVVRRFLKQRQEGVPADPGRRA